MEGAGVEPSIRLESVISFFSKKKKKKKKQGVREIKWELNFDESAILVVFRDLILINKF